MHSFCFRPRKVNQNERIICGRLMWHLLRECFRKVWPFQVDGWRWKYEKHSFVNICTVVRGRSVFKFSSDRRIVVKDTVFKLFFFNLTTITNRSWYQQHRSNNKADYRIENCISFIWQLLFNEFWVSWKNASNQCCQSNIFLMSWNTLVSWRTTDGKPGIDKNKSDHV